MRSAYVWCGNVRLSRSVRVLFHSNGNSNLPARTITTTILNKLTALSILQQSERASERVNGRTTANPNDWLIVLKGFKVLLNINWNFFSLAGCCCCSYTVNGHCWTFYWENREMCCVHWVSASFFLVIFFSPSTFCSKAKCLCWTLPFGHPCLIHVQAWYIDAQIRIRLLIICAHANGSHSKRHRSQRSAQASFTNQHFSKRTAIDTWPLHCI